MNSLSISIASAITLFFSLSFGQKDSTSTPYLQKPTFAQSNYFQAFSGGINAIYHDSKTKGGFDLAVQTCHYFLITGRRVKNDSLHKVLTKASTPISKLYKGFHFFVLNRAAVNFDSIQAMANDYLTSLRPSPFTLRVKKELFLSKQKALSPFNFAPIISFIITGDGRAVPYANRDSHVKVGASGHLYMTFSTIFKRIEYDMAGNKIDQGVVYLKPSIGMAYGSDQLMKSVLTSKRNTPVFSSECRVGFRSDKHSIKDFSFLIGYTMSQIVGPKIRAGLVLSAIN